MKPIEGFKAEQNSASFPMLPKGLYTAKIMGAKVEGNAPDQRLIIRLDISEGEFIGYYSRRYKADQARGSQYTVKYKGDYVLQVPDKSNPNRQKYEWQYDQDVRTFSGAIWAIEQSNPGYHWDWNEDGLKGKSVGINVCEGTYNGNPYTRIGRLESLEEMKAGKVKVMKDMKPRGDAQPAQSAPETFTRVDEEDIPF